MLANVPRFYFPLYHHALSLTMCPTPPETMHCETVLIPSLINHAFIWTLTMFFHHALTPSRLFDYFTPPPPLSIMHLSGLFPLPPLLCMLSYEYLLLVQSPVLFAWDFPVSGEDPVEVDTNTNTDESNTQEKKRKSTQCAHKWKAEGWNWIKAPYQYNITAGLTLHWKTKGWLYLYSEKNETSLDWENGSGMMRESKRGNFHKGVIYTKYAWKTYLPKSSRFLTIYQTKRTNSIF